MLKCSVTVNLVDLVVQYIKYLFSSGRTVRIRTSKCNYKSL